MSCEALTLTAITAKPTKRIGDDLVTEIVATGTCLDCGGQDLLCYTLTFGLQSVREFGVEKARQGYAKKIKDMQIDTLGPISFQRFLETAMDALRRVDLEKLSKIQCSPSSM